MNTDTDSAEIWQSRDAVMQELLNAARVVASTQVNTLILGESGSGRQRLARAIHDQSPRREGPFVAVNCGALSSARAEPLLFGDVGEHPDAAGMPGTGYVLAAAGGTLFLEDISALSPGAQVKLLHLLERGEIIHQGAVPAMSVDVRIVAASHRDLAQAVADRAFHPDLFYRLQVVPLSIPPLRERPRDIACLARRFLTELAARHDVAPAKLAPDALPPLAAYPWPGNVRELRNLCERLTLLLPGRTIGAENLPAEFRYRAQPATASVALPSTGLDLAELEKDLITQALARTGGNRSRAARLLGLTRDTLLYRLKKFALR